MEKLEVFTIKVNFAGSGDEVWRKAVRSIKFKLDLEKLANNKKINNDKIQEVLDEVTKNKVPHKQKGILIIDKNQGYLLGETCEEMYGSRVVKDNYVYYFKSKPNKNQVTYTIPGVDGYMFTKSTAGWKDMGEYSIKNTTQKVVPLIEKQISDEIVNRSPNNKIVVWIKGHSRGGVSASFLLKKLSQKYRDYIINDDIEVCISQFDPVPGKKKSWLQTFSDRSEEDYSYADPEGYEEFKLNELSEKIKSAVVFSINPGYGPANDDFTMQKVRGAKVIIITPENHAVGLYKTGVGGKKRGYKFKYKVDGVEKEITVSPGKLWKLNPGIYWAENNEAKLRFDLTEIDRQNFKEYIKELSDSKVSQYRRNFLTGLIYNDEDINSFVTPKIKECFEKEGWYVIIKALKNEFTQYNDKAFVEDLKHIEKSDLKEIESALDKLDKELKNCKIKKYVLDELEKESKKHQKVR